MSAPTETDVKETAQPCPNQEKPCHQLHASVNLGTAVQYADGSFSMLQYDTAVEGYRGVESETAEFREQDWLWPE